MLFSGPSRIGGRPCAGAGAGAGVRECGSAGLSLYSSSALRAPLDSP